MGLELFFLLLQQQRLVLLHEFEGFVLARRRAEAVADFARDDAPAVGFVFGDGGAEALDLEYHRFVSKVCLGGLLWWFEGDALPVISGLRASR